MRCPQGHDTAGSCIYTLKEYNEGMNQPQKFQLLRLFHQLGTATRIEESTHKQQSDEINCVKGRG
jgi:hypothetical protein